MSDSISDAQGHAMGASDFDPRDIVTPHAFEVDEELLNTPLAEPWQRLGALLADLAIAGFIGNVAGGLVGIVVAYVFYRVATRRGIASRWKRWTRGCLVLIGATVLFVLSIALVQDAHQWGPTGPSLTALIPGIQSETSEQTELDVPSADSMAPAPPDSAPLHVLQQTEDLDSPHPPQESSLPPDTERPNRAANLLQHYAQAIAERDSAALDTLTAPVQSLVAGHRLAALKENVHTLQTRNGELVDEMEELQEQINEPSLWRMTRATANDLGLTIGWIGLYFTLFLAWWDGRTPGKYLFGIRVVRLGGEPLTLWQAFERFGGYAAGIATGLLGFIQLYWDPNRQGIHDRVARTVVIRTRSTSSSERGSQ
ncbi:hypothetical protein BSZ35_07870 [Salinibacter sp. 10B]|uniref:RDD family protein n=1 Tax=Salinibacter sp. 10B TaxID=1923971 RepID=UPI000D2C3355|nr:RDD family protein [Salinibacter sp. 10B]PQJ34523.1 hypothetical protein BSZ35_07870 [Salinibacter sp. 10B]